MHTVGSHLTARPQSRQRRTPIKVRAHSANHVMRRWRHRNSIAGWINIEPRQHARKTRESLNKSPRRKVPAVKKYMTLAATGKMANDGFTHNITRRKLRHRMKTLHEAIAIAIDEIRTLPAHRFTDEHSPSTCYVQRGGVKLEELKIGEFRARAPRHGNAVAGGNFRVGGFAEHLPCSAGSKHGCARPDDLQPVARMPAQRTKHAPCSIRSA